MITETSQYHGAFFVMLFDTLDIPVTIERLSNFGTGYYLLAGRIPFYLKLSTKRKGPWTFTFLRSHQEAQEKLFLTYGECFTCMICGRDGVAGINMKELRQISDGDFEEQESVSIRRQLNSLYQIKGRDGALEYRVSRQAIFDKLRTEITRENIE